MKKFFGVNYVGMDTLRENKMHHPIRLEYYKLQNEELENSYGIEVVKTEYKNQTPYTEKEVIEYVTHDEQKIDVLLEQFKRGTVTPIGASEMVIEVMKSLNSN